MEKNIPVVNHCFWAQFIAKVVEGLFPDIFHLHDWKNIKTTRLTIIIIHKIHTSLQFRIHAKELFSGLATQSTDKLEIHS